MEIQKQYKPDLNRASCVLQKMGLRHFHNGVARKTAPNLPTPP